MRSAEIFATIGFIIIVGEHSRRGVHRVDGRVRSAGVEGYRVGGGELSRVLKVHTRASHLRRFQVVFYANYFKRRSGDASMIPAREKGLTRVVVAGFSRTD